MYQKNYNAFYIVCEKKIMVYTIYAYGNIYTRVMFHNVKTGDSQLPMSKQLKTFGV